VGQCLHAIHRSDIVILGGSAASLSFAVGHVSSRGEVSACKAAKTTAQRRANKRALQAAVATPVPSYLLADPSTTKYHQLLPGWSWAIVGRPPVPLSRRAGLPEISPVIP
jgi:hypothetical protein